MALGEDDRYAITASVHQIRSAESLAGADRAHVAGALAALGHPPSIRPEALAPADFPPLAEALAWTG